jgi:Tfp pilus assembly protein PilE
MPPLKRTEQKTDQHRRSAFTLIEIMIVGGLIALLASIAVPCFLRYRSHAQRNTCVSNLKEIDYAMEEWALEHKMSANAPVNADDISPYLKGSVVCPCGGKSFSDSYSVSRVSESPECLKSPKTHAWLADH